jgi:hypothetical protein
VPVVHGDCLAVMPTLEEASVDAVVCDPPYGLSFMGKDWDHGIPGVAFWREALRVAKPGAALLAFGGTRTYHRLACAIEDAGWEIRDTLSWLYGSGFPKSLDVSKAMDKAAGAEREVVKGGGRSNVGTGARSNGRSNFSQVLVDPTNDRTVKNDISLPASDLAKQWAGWGTALKPAHEPILLCSKPLTVEQHFTIIARAFTSLIFEAALCGGVSASDVEQSSSAIRARLQKGADSSVLDGARIRSLASVEIVPCAGPSSTSPVDTSTAHGGTRGFTALSHVRQQTCEAETSEPPTPPGQAGDLLTRLMAMCTSVIADGISVSTVSLWSSISAELLDAASTYTIETASRLTTALKTLNSLMWPIISGDTGSSSPSQLTPQHTPIILARKPLIGTVAATVAEYGTGALNIDGCRIGAVSGDDYGRSAANARGTINAHQGFEGKSFAIKERDGDYASPAGRWPANVVLSEDAAALLDAQSGTLHTHPGTMQSESKPGWYGKGTTQKPGTVLSHGDTGGASRFYYVAKASRREREAGLEGMRQDGRRVFMASSGRTQVDGEWVETHSEPVPRTNHHPTVKPLALMRWLCRLVTPPGGLVLDPFTGSGSTGCAAVLEGFRFLGIEQEAEYVAIAERRIAHWAATVQPDLEPAA